MILCVAANPSIDRLFRVDRLAPGTIHRPSELVAVPGGKGLNVARSAVRLGAEVAAVALLAGHAGRFVAERLVEDGVRLEAVWTAGETRSSLSVAPDGEPLTEFYEHGEPVEAAAWAEFAAAVSRLAASAEWMTISGSLPPGAPADGYLRLIGRARTAFDSSEAGVEARPALVKVNAEEAAGLTGVADPLRAARVLAEGAGGAAVVTLGADGAIAVDAGGGAWRVTLDVRGPYPVGSGDAFLAGLVVALDRGQPLDGALRLAAGAGAANAEVPGPAVFERARAEELAGRAVVAAG